MKQTRCFVAIEIPDELKRRIGEYISSLKEIAPEIKWIKTKNLHITLKFIGEITDDLLLNIKKELTGIEADFRPFSLSIESSGFFPKVYKPRVVWLGLTGEKINNLFKVHHWIDNKLGNLGIEMEKRRFSPHLTIGRIKQPKKYENLLGYMKTNNFKSCSFYIKQIYLMRSILKSSGAEYSKLETYNLSD